MDTRFRNSIELKLDKKLGIAHLSVKASEYKVEVFKLSINDINSILMQFTDAMRDQEGPEEIFIEPKNDEKNQEDTGLDN